MPVNLKNRSVLEMSDFTREEIRFLLDLSQGPEARQVRRHRDAAARAARTSA